MYDRLSVRSALVAASLAALLTPAFATAAWESMQGPYGGNVVEVARASNGTLAAITGNQVFRSTDGGASWVPISEGEIINANGVAITSGGTIYVGTSGRGVVWTSNGGATWQENKIEVNTHTGVGETVVAIERFGSVLYASRWRSTNGGASFTEMSIYGTDFARNGAGDVYAGTLLSGVYSTADGGATWTPANAGIESVGVSCVAVDAQDRVFTGSRTSGVWRSDDDGATWVDVTPAALDSGVADLAVLPSGRVFAALVGGGLAYTDDQGGTWSPAPAATNATRFVMIEPADSVLLTAQALSGVVEYDADATAAIERNGPDMTHAFLRDIAGLDSGTHLLTVYGGGVQRSVDGGETWSGSSAGLSTGVVTEIARDAGGRAYIATLDGVRISDDDGLTWTNPSPGSAPGTDWTRGVLVSPTTGTVFARVDSAGGWIVHRSTDRGVNWTRAAGSVDFAFPSAIQAWAMSDDGDLYLSAQSFAPLFYVSTDDGLTLVEATLPFGTHLTGVVAFAGGRVTGVTGAGDLHESLDGGATWSALPDGPWPGGFQGAVTAIGRDANGDVLAAPAVGVPHRISGGVWSPVDLSWPAGTNADVTFLAQTADGIFAGTATSGLARSRAIVTDVRGSGETRSRAFLGRATPTPFRTNTTVRLFLPRAERVSADVFGVHGRRVATLHDGALSAGEHLLEWNGTNDAGEPVAAGVYFVRALAGGRRAIERIVLVR